MWKALLLILIAFYNQVFVSFLKMITGNSNMLMLFLFNSYVNVVFIQFILFTVATHNVVYLSL